MFEARRGVIYPLAHTSWTGYYDAASCMFLKYEAFQSKTKKTPLW